MSGHEVTYAVDFRTSEHRRSDSVDGSIERTNPPIARIARLMALAIRLQGLIQDGKIRDYADAARRGRVTRARMTQLMRLLDLAPDIQEQILFLPPTPRLNERNLRPVARCIDWSEQRRMFRQLVPDIAADPKTRPTA